MQQNNDGESKFENIDFISKLRKFEFNPLTILSIFIMINGECWVNNNKYTHVYNVYNVYIVYNVICIEHLRTRYLCLEYKKKIL